MILIKRYISEFGLTILCILILYLINPFGLSIIFGYLLVVAFLLLKKNHLLVSLDGDAFWILLFSITYTAFDALGPHKGVQFLITQAVFPIIFYLFGKLLVLKKTTKSEVVLLLITLGLIFAFTSIVSTSLSLLTEGFKVNNRDIPNIWNGKPMSATGAAGVIIYPLLLPGVLLTGKKIMNKYILLFLVIIYLITLLCSFRLGSRTCLAITAISIIIGFIKVLISQNLLQNIRFIAVTTIITVLLLMFFPLNLEADYLSVLGHRLQEGNASSVATAGNRTGLWQEAIANMIKYPLGYPEGHLAHNTWLDIARVAGLLPLLLFIITNFRFVMLIKNIFSLDNKNITLTTLFCLYGIGTFLLFFAEPVILGNYFFVTFLFLLHGILRQCADNYKRKLW